MENDYVRVKINKRGEMASLWDKRASREVIDASTRAANHFVIYDDVPFYWWVFILGSSRLICCTRCLLALFLGTRGIR